MDSTLALGAFRIARGAGGEAVREREPRRAGEGRSVWNPNSCVLIDYRLWAARSEGRQWVDHCIELYVRGYPRAQELAREHNVPICGKDFKIGQTLLKTILAPGFKACMLGLNG